MKTDISFSKTVEGYLLAASARHLSTHTIADYMNTFRKFKVFLKNDPPSRSITPKLIEEFLASQTVSKKTILNYHCGLSALWHWAADEDLVDENILYKVQRVKPTKKSIIPYSEDDVKAMLGAIFTSKAYSRPGKYDSKHSLPNIDRNRAIILLLLDTGLRASELCSLRIHHVDLHNRRLTVLGKGSKERTIPFSARTGQAIWKYLANRKDSSVEDLLFKTNVDGPMNRDRLLKTLMAIGRRAGLRDVCVHRFRHTFAINYLRNGGDPWSLQMILGHSTMEMVKTYLALAQADLDRNHKIASPVDHWRL
jgi:site-specific recombinase XerD